MAMESIRLDKMLSSQLNISRSEVKRLLRTGTVQVNAVSTDACELRINPETDSVTVAGQAVSYEKFVYIMMNKPRGILSASTDKSRETVIDLVPSSMRRQNLFPVGRLDKDTTGLMIITNDGDYAHQVISPKNKTKKVYFASLDAPADEGLVTEFANGVILASGERCRPAGLEILDNNSARLTLYDGKYHQVKRMFGVFGIGVNSLHREAIGGLTLPDNLKQGECIPLTANDILKTL